MRKLCLLLIDAASAQLSYIIDKRQRKWHLSWGIFPALCSCIDVPPCSERLHPCCVGIFVVSSFDGDRGLLVHALLVLCSRYSPSKSLADWLHARYSYTPPTRARHEPGRRQRETRDTAVESRLKRRVRGSWCIKDISVTYNFFIALEACMLLGDSTATKQ